MGFVTNAVKAAVESSMKEVEKRLVEIDTRHKELTMKAMEDMVAKFGEFEESLLSKVKVLETEIDNLKTKVVKLSDGGTVGPT